MKRALIVPEACAGCIPCAVEETCANHAIIRESQDDKPWIDFYKCSGCLRCKALCRYGAIEDISQPCNGQGRMGW